MTVRFMVELDQPEGTTVEEVAAYIGDAVATWKGSLRPPGGECPSDPGDPMFHLDADSVVVVYEKPH